MRYSVLAGRILFSLSFVMAGFGHFSSQEIAFAAAQGVPLASVVVPLSGILALVGGLSIAFGYKAKWGSSVDCSIPGSRNRRGAQLLVSERPTRRPRPDGTLHEERIADRKCVFYFLLWFGSVQSGCAPA